jgi:hypothetical protein
MMNTKVLSRKRWWKGNVEGVMVSWNQSKVTWVLNLLILTS